MDNCHEGGSAMKTAPQRWAIALGWLFCVLSTPSLALTATEVAKLLASDGAADDQFGSSVAVDGDIAVWDW